MTSTHGATAYSRMGRYQTPPLTASIQFVNDTDSALQRAWTALIDDLLALRGLEDDWDGQGAEAPHSALVDSAIQLAQRLQATRQSPADRVIAGVSGSVFFEWFAPVGYTEIEVTAPGRAEVTVVRKNSEKKGEVFPLVDWE